MLTWQQEYLERFAAAHVLVELLWAMTVALSSCVQAGASRRQRLQALFSGAQV
jgi:hypothetical protein